MKRNSRVIVSGMACAIAMTSVAQAELVRQPTQVGTSIDLGQLVKGDLYDGSSQAGVVRKQTLTRTGVYLTESGTYNEKLTIKLSIGGLFWFAIPETKDFQDRRIQFGPGVGQAQGVYAFGDDPQNPAASLQFGLFPHKYSESVNLGEYLYRSGTYPGTLTSGGWSYLNAAAYMAQGIRLNVPMFEGKLTHDLTLYMERDLEPANDLSPGYMLTYKPAAFLSLGAGLVWSHAISLNSDRLAPETDDNAYYTVNGLPVKNYSSIYGADPADISKGYYTFRGFKTAGRASLDFGALFNSESIRPGEFSLYSEIALLGIKNQPYYYENRAHRRPLMAGINLPTFGLLDRLTFEYEYLASPFPNSNAAVLQGQLPVPVQDPHASVTDTSTGAPVLDPITGRPILINDPKNAKYNDPKWTVYARRQVMDGFSITAQAASDHLRHFNRAATPAAQSATFKSNDWYYIIRLEFGI